MREAPATPALTLGAVLYANAKAPVAEEEWAALVRATAAGDQLALHGLYDRAHRVVFTLAFRITAKRESAEEITIDVFHDIWRHAARYDAENGTVLGWIMNQTRSRAIDRLRFEGRKKRSHHRGVELGAQWEPDPENVMQAKEQGLALASALAGLTPHERQAIETTFFAGLSYSEAAARLGQPLGTIKTRIRSGLHKLRLSLAAQAVRP